eukprot:s487_g9.t1
MHSLALYPGSYGSMAQVAEVFSEAELQALCGSHNGLTTLLLWAPWHAPSVHLTKVLEAIAAEQKTASFAKVATANQHCIFVSSAFDNPSGVTLSCGAEVATMGAVDIVDIPIRLTEELLVTLAIVIALVFIWTYRANIMLALTGDTKLHGSFLDCVWCCCFQCCGLCTGEWTGCFTMFPCCPARWRRRPLNSPNAVLVNKAPAAQPGSL